MSRQLLTYLNGERKGLLYNFLVSHEGEPRIAWYPSAGRDFRALMYLDASYSEVAPAIGPEPEPPDIFLFTDYHPRIETLLEVGGLLYQDDATTVVIKDLEELPPLHIPQHPEVVIRPIQREHTRAFFMTISVKSAVLGTMEHSAIYVFAENEAFFCEVLQPNRARLSHVIHIRYGGGLGGGRASGVWILNVLRLLSCEMYITDGHGMWQSGDEFMRILSCTTGNMRRPSASNSHDPGSSMVESRRCDLESCGR